MGSKANSKWRDVAYSSIRINRRIEKAEKCEITEQNLREISGLSADQERQSIIIFG
jgi:hypothetical protein